MVSSAKFAKQKMTQRIGLAVIVAALMFLPALAQQVALPAAPSSVSVTEQPKGKSFAKPEDAVAALYAAACRNDEKELLVILGPDAKEIVEWSDDPNERKEQRAFFAQKYERVHRLVKEPDNTVALYVGAENWPLPIPLVEYKGAWYFDADLGEQEIRYRRIGRNEMEAIEVCRALVDAEKEYYANGHQYTATFNSGENSHDGLYWKSGDDSNKSPIGPYLAHAGVGETNSAPAQPFHGYYYRVLLQETDGFAILAFPAEYRSSGVMTFLVSQDGTAYEKDLGVQTATAATNFASAHPNSSWKQVE
jgi:hypothetical protein